MAISPIESGRMSCGQNPPIDNLDEFNFYIKKQDPRHLPGASWVLDAMTPLLHHTKRWCHSAAFTTTIVHTHHLLRLRMAIEGVFSRTIVRKSMVRLCHKPSFIVNNFRQFTNALNRPGHFNQLLAKPLIFRWGYSPHYGIISPKSQFIICSYPMVQ